MKMRKIIAVMAAALMLFSILPMAVFAADTFEKYTGSITEGDYLIVYDGKAMKATVSSDRFGYDSVTASNNAITNPDDSIVWHIAPLSDGYWSIFNAATGKYASGTGAKNKGKLVASVSDDYAMWTVTGSNTYEFVNKGNKAKGVNANLRNNGTYGFACYATGTGGALTLYKLVVPEEGDCDHANAEYEYDCQPTTCPDCGNELPAKADHKYAEEITVNPDCTTAGEKTLTCECGDVKTETIPALGHTFVDGFCSVCDEPQPLEATITFDNTNKMTSSSNTQQVWQENGIVVTYDKNSYNSNLVVNVNPIRFYAGTKVTIAYPGLTKMEIVANNTSYATILGNSISGSVVDGTKVTYTLSEVADSFAFVLSAQARVNSITVYGSAPSDCEHDYVGVETQAPTCTVQGVMTYTCSKCEESYTEAIATIPHSYVEDVIDSTCTTTGTKTYTCSVCSDSYDEVIPVKNHNYVDDVCADCGHVKAYKGTITFDADKTQRFDYSTQIQVWANEGLTLTNNKLTGNNIGDYSAPARFYKNSGIVIEFPEMSKLIIDANVENRADYLWDDTLEAAGLTYTEADGIYTITFDEPKNSLELTCANQVRANSITAIVAHDCAYDHAFDVDCNKCGAIREVETVITHDGTSASEDVRGVAARFTLKVEGMGINDTTAIYDNATVNGYKLISMGAIASNGNSSLEIPAVYLCDDDVSASAKFAIRVINIPEGKEDVTITFTPYFVVEIDGEQVTIYGEAQSASYAEKIG